MLRTLVGFLWTIIIVVLGALFGLGLFLGYKSKAKAEDKRRQKQRAELVCLYRDLKGRGMDKEAAALLESII